MAIHTFKKAEPSDIQEIVDIDYELFPLNNFNERTLGQHVVHDICYLIHVDGDLAAYAVVGNTDSPMLDILRLGVKEPYRKAGLASVLLDNVVRLDKDVMLTVLKNNTPAINLYKKHGFEIIGVMPQHESWVMRRLIHQPALP